MAQADHDALPPGRHRHLQGAGATIGAGMRCVGIARGELAAHLTAGTVTPELVVSSFDEFLDDVGCWLVA